MAINFRDDPLNTPHKLDGSPVKGGPWLRVGHADESLDGKFSVSPEMIRDQDMHVIAIACKEDDDFCRGKVAVFIAPYTGLNGGAVRDARFEEGKVPLPTSGKDVRDYQGRETNFPSVARFYWDMKDELKNVRDVHAVTGLAYKDVGSEETKRVARDWEIDGKWRGTYNVSRTGLIGLMDHKGQQYITPNNPDTITLLEKCGFARARDYEIPFSCGESPVDPGDSKDTRPAYNFINKIQKTMAYQRGIIETPELNLRNGI